MYSKSGIVTDQSTAQVPVAAASVFVRANDGSLASLFDADGNDLHNPLTTDVFGAYSYHVESAGQYTHEYWFGARKRYIENTVVGSLIAAVNSSPENAGKFIAYDANGNPTASIGTGADIGLRTDLAANTGSTLIKANDGNTVQDALDSLAGATSSISATAYTLLAADANKLLNFTAATAVTVTVPDNLPDVFACALCQGGLGQVTISPAAGVSVNETDGNYTSEAQYVVLALQAIGADTFILSGRTVA